MDGGGFCLSPYYPCCKPKIFPLYSVLYSRVNFYETTTHKVINLLSYSIKIKNYLKKDML